LREKWSRDDGSNENMSMPLESPGRFRRPRE